MCLQLVLPAGPAPDTNDKWTPPLHSPWATCVHTACSGCHHCQPLGIRWAHRAPEDPKGPCSHYGLTAVVVTIGHTVADVMGSSGLSQWDASSVPWTPEPHHTKCPPHLSFAPLGPVCPPPPAAGEGQSVYKIWKCVKKARQGTRILKNWVNIMSSKECSEFSVADPKEMRYMNCMIKSSKLLS